jgi:para-nitrobenzyl esterase
VYAADTQWQVMHLGPEPMAAPDRHRAQDLLLDRIWGK